MEKNSLLLEEKVQENQQFTLGYMNNNIHKEFYNVTREIISDVALF